MAYWCLPPLLALFIYWPALGAWFQDDDFVWLNLLPNIHSWGDLWYALFHPTIHGMWRPLGERAYFLLVQSLFGYSSGLPFHIVAFGMQFANRALISAITLKLTRSRVVGFLAPVFWIANDKLTRTMTWSSNINYISCGFFVLAALWFLLRHTETGRMRYPVAMWTVFILGLGALEEVIVFPLMAALYTLACARAYFKRTLSLFGAAALFGLAHQVLAPNQAGALYTMHFDGTIFSTLKQYWEMALLPDNFKIFTGLPSYVGGAGVIVFTAALLGFASYQAFRRNWIPLLFLGWFVSLLLPMLPLRDHILSYYLALPLIGLAMLAADGVAHAWRDGLTWRAAAAALVAFFLLESAPVARKATKALAFRSWAIEAMVKGVAQAHQVHPDRDILLKDAGDDLVWGAINERCFLFLGFDNVYLAPATDAHITPHPELGDITPFIMPEATVREKQGRLLVLACKRDHLEDITGEYYASLSPAAQGGDSAAALATDRVDVADPSSAGRLDQAWYPPDRGFRWMSKRASVRMTTSPGRAQKCTSADTARLPRCRKAPSP